MKVFQSPVGAVNNYDWWVCIYDSDRPGWRLGRGGGEVVRERRRDGTRCEGKMKGGREGGRRGRREGEDGLEFME